MLNYFFCKGSSIKIVAAQVGLDPGHRLERLPGILVASLWKLILRTLAQKATRLILDPASGGNSSVKRHSLLSSG